MDNNEQNNNQPQSRILIERQYIKDLSFEIPNSPSIFQYAQKSPEIKLAVDIQVEDVEQDKYEVILTMHSTAEVKQDEGEEKLVMFELELRYAGIFHMINLPKEHLQTNLVIYCPNLLFPYARSAIFNTTMNSGFLPLQIEPINFAEIYLKKQQEQQKT